MDHGSRATRWFVAFLVTWAFTVSSQVQAGAAIAEHHQDLAFRVSIALWPASAVTVLGFWYHARAPRAGRAVDRALIAILVALTLVVVLAPRWLIEFLPAADGTPPRVAGIGPLLYLLPISFIAMSACAYDLARLARTQTPEVRASHRILAAGFAWYPLYRAPLAPVRALVEGVWNPLLTGSSDLNALGRFYENSAHAVIVAAGLLALAAYVALWRDARPEDRPTRAVVEGLAVSAGVVGVARGAFTGLDTITLAASTIVIPVIAGYGIARHRMFGADRRARWAVKGSTVAAAFLAVFFIVSEGAAALFEDQTGSQWFGIGAASLLVFAIAPLQRMADRFAGAAVPASLATTTGAATYAEHVRIAWADGHLGPEERLALDAARARLGLSEAEAMRIEREVARAFTARESPPGA